MKKWIILLSIPLVIFSCKQEERVGSLKIPAGSPAFFSSDLPLPVIPAQEAWMNIYWKAWQLMYQNIHNGTAGNKFTSRYLDEGFNELIYQWDTCFMAMFAMYGGDHYPAMESLDNFYQKQEGDGWICRVYRESDGTAAEKPSGDEPMINPPLFAWVEWKYYLLTGDKSRFNWVLPVLDRYYNWIDRNCRGAAGLYFTTHLGSGMDNSPREGISRGGWVDLSAQMALFAKYMMLMAGEEKDEALLTVYQQRYRLLTRLINSLMWDENSGFYFDITAGGKKITTRTAAAFWTMCSEVATFPQARKLAEHLQNPDEFYRKHLFPSLAASHPEYDSRGHYWRGGVWAPLNYMIIKGLDMFPLRELAAVAAVNHLDNICRVYQEFTPVPADLALDERDGQYQTLWECYAPDLWQPATRWDGQYLSRQDFVGWTGLGPVALLLENVIGLQPSAPDDKLYWNLRLREPHGVENFRFGDNQVDIYCRSNDLPAGKAVLSIYSTSPFQLIVSTQVGIQERAVKEGDNQFEISL